MESNEPGPGTTQGLPSGPKGEGAGDRTRDKAVTYNRGVPTYNQHCFSITGAGTDGPRLG